MNCELNRSETREKSKKQAKKGLSTQTVAGPVKRRRKEFIAHTLVVDRHDLVAATRRSAGLFRQKLLGSGRIAAKNNNY